jgi:hypothetical protein
MVVVTIPESKPYCIQLENILQPGVIWRTKRNVPMAAKVATPIVYPSRV